MYNVIMLPRRNLRKVKKSIYFKFPSIITLIAATCMLSSLLTACNDAPNFDQAREEGTKHKETIATAFALNETMQNHSFQGTLNVNLNLFLDKEYLQDLPYAHLFAKGMTWEGIVHRDPAQLESKISLDLMDQGTPTTIPILIKDKQLYFQIPILNLDNEYFTLPMADISAMNVSSISALLLTESALNEINKYIFAEIDPKWISTTASQTSTADQTNRTAPVRYEIQVTAENTDEIKSAVSSALYRWVDHLNQELTEDRVDKEALPEVESSIKQLRLQPGGSIAVVINPEGYVIEQFVELFRENVTNGESPVAFTYGILIEQVNQAPQITVAAPENLLDFQNVLNLLEKNLREKSEK
jgi:hypothetical protein